MEHKSFVTHYGKLFLAVLSVFTVLFGIYLFASNNTLRKSQDKIIESYIKHVQSVDSMYLARVGSMTDLLSTSQTAAEFVIDSALVSEVLKSNKRMSKVQYDNLRLLLNEYHSLAEKKYQDHLNLLLRDSLFINTELALLGGQTQQMLQLHLDRIEHEHSNVTLWGAVLTILFIVFAFYSFFKMDDLISSGQKGLARLEDLETKANTAINNIEQARLGSESKSKEIVDAFTQNFEKTTSNFSKQMEDKLSDLNKCVESAQEILRNLKSAEEVKDNE